MPVFIILLVFFLWLLNWILIFNMDLSLGNIQEWAANNETRGQIEDTVLYGYYSKCILLIPVYVDAHKIKENEYLWSKNVTREDYCRA